MKINYLFSKIDRDKGFNTKQIKYIKEDIKNNMNITFIASLFNEYERNDKQVKEIIKVFNNINITFNKIHLIDNRISKENSIKYIEESDIIYLLGGSPEEEIKSIKEYNLFDILKERDGITIGTSAGAMNQAKKIIYKDDFDNYKIKEYEGLGIIDYNIYPHFDVNNKEYMEEVYEISKYIKIIGLPNESFIRVKDSNIEIIGNYYIIKNGIIEREND